MSTHWFTRVNVMTASCHAGAFYFFICNFFIFVRGWTARWFGGVSSWGCGLVGWGCCWWCGCFDVLVVGWSGFDISGAVLFDSFKVINSFRGSHCGTELFKSPTFHYSVTVLDHFLLLHFFYSFSSVSFLFTMFLSSSSSLVVLQVWSGERSVCLQGSYVRETLRSGGVWLLLYCSGSLHLRSRGRKVWTCE